MQKLKDCRARVYGSPLGKAVNDPHGDDTYMVESHGRSHSSACRIFATVRRDGLVAICLRGDIPLSSEVRSWLRMAGAEMTAGKVVDVVFEVTPNSVSRLEDLAYAIAYAEHSDEGVYDEANNNDRCPRLARAIGRLQGILDEHWTTEKLRSNRE